MNTHNYENGRQTDINAKNIELAQSIIHMIVSYKLVEYAEVEREREFVFNEIIDDPTFTVFDMESEGMKNQATQHYLQLQRDYFHTLYTKKAHFWGKNIMKMLVFKRK